jgi:hypothetical protein
VVHLVHGKTTYGKAAGSGSRTAFGLYSLQAHSNRAQGVRYSRRACRNGFVVLGTSDRPTGRKEPIQAGLAESVGVEPYRLSPHPTAGYKAAAPPRRGPLSEPEKWPFAEYNVPNVEVIPEPESPSVQEVRENPINSVGIIVGSTTMLYV